MFSFSNNGYSREEVDKYIARLKADYEAKLMEEKLKVLESENKLLDFKKKSLDLESRERNIMSALDAFKRYQDEGSKTITALRLEQLRMVYQEFDLLMSELSLKYNGIESNVSLNKVKEALRTIVDNVELEKENITSKANTENDSMRMLLNKMQGYKKAQDNPREVKISRVQENPVQTQEAQAFDLKAAINPKDDLAEIMKAFDFYNPDDNI